MIPNKRFSRRRFLNILGASTTALIACPELSFGSNELNELSKHSWSGEVLGANAQMQLYGIGQKEGQQIISDCLNEISRLEKIFSLYRADSIICSLNRKGFFTDAPPELVAVLKSANELSELSGGLFDVSVQPLWKHLYYHSGAELNPKDITKLSGLIDYRNIVIQGNDIQFAKKGMQITLNGIAQGYITDCVRALLSTRGIAKALLQLGETFAIGNNQFGNPWRIGIEDPNTNQIAHTLELKDLAVATSGGYGTRFSQSAIAHHLLNPRTNSSPEYYSSLSVIADNATLADGLSTTLSLMPRQKHQALLAHYSGAKTFIL